MLHKIMRAWFSLMIGLALLLGPGGARAQEADPTPTDPPPDGLAGAAQEVTPADVSVQAAGGGYVYALLDVGGGANQIYGFQVNELTGALTALSGFPVSTGSNGTGNFISERMAFDAANSRLYVINDGSDTASAFAVNMTTGALTALPFSPINLGSGNWNCLAVHPGGSPLIVGDGDGTPTVASFNVSATSAVAAAGSPFATGAARPFSCAFSRDGAYVYAGGNLGPSLAGFVVNATTGVLTALPGSPFTSGADAPIAYATDSAGRLFVANQAANQVRAFTTSGGLPSPALSNPFTSGLTQASHGLLHPNGYYLVADRIDDRVGVYRISGSGSGTTLSAVSGSPFAAGGSLTNILALNQSGAFLFAANGDTRNLTTFSLNAATSALTSLGTQPANTLGAAGRITGLAYAGQPQPPSPPGGGFVYTLRDVNTGNQIYGYSVNETTGALTELPGFPLGTGGNGNGADAFQRIAYDPANSRLYAVNALSNTVSAFSVNRATGALTPLSFSPFSIGAGDWYCVAVQPGGATLVVGSLSGPLASFNLTASSATPAAGSPFASGSGAASCAFSQDGAYFYAGGNPATFSGLSVNAGTGVLTVLPGSPYNSGGSVPLALATDNSGRLFMANAASNVRVFTTSSGAPSPVLGNPFASGLSLGVSGTLHPAGYYLAADRSGNRVGVYRISGSGPSTTLAAVSGSPFGSGGLYTQGLTLNRAGTFLFVMNSDSRNFTSYSVEAATGALNGTAIQPLNTAGDAGRLTGLAYVPGLNYVFLPLVQR